LDGWQHKHQTNEAEIALWERVFPRARNTGILTERAPAFDIDILSPDAAAAVEDIAKEWADSRDGAMPVRIGRAPKRALLFRADVPFAKVQCSLIAPNGDTGQKLEMLADGQQIVVAGIHPETNKPYSWHGGEPGEIERRQLILVNEADVKRLFELSTALLVKDFGYVLARRSQQSRHAWADLLANIRAGRELHDTIVAIAAKLAASGMDEGAIIAFIRSEMQASQIPHDARWRERLDDIPRIVASAIEKFARQHTETVKLESFYGYMPLHNYIFEPTRETWPAGSVNARIGPVPLLDANGKPKTDPEGKPITMRASAWLDRHRPIEQMTWAPGMPTIIKNRLIAEGGWIEHSGVTVFNLYRPSTISPGNPNEAGPWLEHVQTVYSDAADHVIDWSAHRVQRPHEKINHALVLGGMQGIGKDTMLAPLKAAVGPWNFLEASPQQLVGRFNGFLKSVVLRISEARDSGDVDRFKFYDHTKAFAASPPEVLRVDEKHTKEHCIVNVTGLIITTNYKDAIYLPPDDRRHFVAWSDRTKEDFSPQYWNALWRWYMTGGIAHVAAYLRERDITAFDAKAPPPKTEAFWCTVDANRAAEDAELADVLDQLGNPSAVTLAQIVGRAPDEFADWLKERRNQKAFSHRMDDCGYEPVRNRDAQDGLWKIRGKRQAVYARKELSPRDRLVVAVQLAGRV
jgi:hypothetical protein